MIRHLSIALLAVATAVAAPVPKKPAKDYQKLADETEWKFAAHDFQDTLAAELKGYDVEAKSESGEETVYLRLSKDGKELAKIVTHLQATVRQRDGVLYYTDFSPHSCGCSVVAFDLTAKKELWKTTLKGVGSIDHSKYFNAVRLEVLDDDAVAVFGKESLGRYYEVVDRGTGKTVGHKVFEEKK